MSKATRGKKNLVAQQQLTGPPTRNANMPGLFSDIVCSLDVGNASWEYIYKIFENEGTITAKDSTPVSNTTYSDVVNSFLHRLAN